MKKLFLIIIVFHNLIFSQNSDENVSAETISDKIQTHCFQNLKPFKELDSLPNWKNHTCSIIDNLFLLQINTENKSFNEELHKSAINRLREISNLFYLEKTPIIFKNAILEDGLVFIGNMARKVCCLERIKNILLVLRKRY